MDLDRLLEKKYAPYLILMAIALMFYALIYIFSGQFSIGAHNWYNNYSRQAYSWLQGRLDIPENRIYLEIAFFPEYGGRMYISFPPFPSIVLLPFVFFWGYNTPDHFIALGLTLITLIYSYKIAFRLLKDKKIAMFFSLFLILGTNYLHMSLWGAVWWLAQNMGFTLLMISVYYAITDNKKHSIISLFALCASMGCRPFNTLYMPIILLLIYKREEGSFLTIIGKMMAYALPAIALGAFYMWLNYARFGSIFEFGHNYLPEHTIDPRGQFHSGRVVRNLSQMFFGMDISYGIRNGFPHYGRTTFAFWLASPMFLCFAVYQFAYWNRKREYIAVADAADGAPVDVPLDGNPADIPPQQLSTSADLYSADETTADVFLRQRKETAIENLIIKLIPILLGIHIFAFSFHRTLGARQFGSRYIADSLPIIFLGLLLMVAKMPKVKHMIYNFFPMLFGALINFHGTIMFLTFYFPFPPVY